MDSETKMVAGLVSLVIICVTICVLVAMGQNHSQTLNYIEGGYSQKFEDGNYIWSKDEK